MARNKKIIGPCHICGTVTKLSYEHVPPRAAFNDRPVVEGRMSDLIENGEFSGPVEGKKVQRGVGGYTLCERCNTTTGGWYGKDYVDWVGQAADVLMGSKGDPTLYYLYRIFPLRVIKQIVCMFFSTNGDRFKEAHQDLVRFVLNKNIVGIKPQIRIYCFLNPSHIARQTGVSGVLDFDKHHTKVISEIAFFPFGYVMSLNEIKPDDRLVDITFFSKFHYSEWKEISLQLPSLPIHSSLPGVYRGARKK